MEAHSNLTEWKRKINNIIKSNQEIQNCINSDSESMQVSGCRNQRYMGNAVIFKTRCDMSMDATDIIWQGVILMI